MGNRRIFRPAVFVVLRRGAESGISFSYPVGFWQLVGACFVGFAKIVKIHDFFLIYGHICAII
jgi:hypothetical protein